MTRPRAELPRHLGIIVDGNRRWARRNGLQGYEGHRHGAEVLRDLAPKILRPDIEYLSVYLFSTENWKRTPREVAYLMNRIGKFARDFAARAHEHGVRMRFLGRHDGLPGYLVAEMQRAEALTASNTAGTLACCLNYGGQTEIADAVKLMLAAGLAPADVSPQTIAAYLYAPDIPPVDLVIRTGGELRTSNFMLWRAAYAELCFLDKMWPECTIDDIDAVLDGYLARGRRFGR